MTTVTQTRLCEHRRLENGIDEFVWYDTTREAVDQWAELVDKIYAELPADSGPLTFRFLTVHQASSMPSASYIASKSKQIETKYTNRPKVRSAILMKSIFLPILKIMVTLVYSRRKQEPVRVFSPDQREQAIRWLLENE